MSKVYYYAESIAESTWNTDGNFQDKVSLSFTPGSSETWLIVATWLFSDSSTSFYTRSRLIRTSGVARDFNDILFLPHDVTDYISVGCFAYETFGSSPGEQTYKIQYYTNYFAGATVKIKEAKITAIRLDSNDKYASSVAYETFSGDTNWHDKVSLTFTPPSAGDYLVLASADMNLLTITYDWRVQLDVDGTAQYDITNQEENYAPARMPWMMVKRVSLTQASHTLKIQVASENSLWAVGIANAYLIALRLSDFDSSYYAESDNRDTTSLTNYQDKVTLTRTVNAKDHLILASCGTDHSNTSSSGYHQLTQDGVSLGEQIREPQDTTTRHFSYVSSKLFSADSQSYTWKLQYKAEANTVGIQDARIAVLQLEALIIIPTVVTNAVTDIFAHIATGNGEVTSSGGGTISQRGFVWSTSVNPTTADSKVVVSGTTGIFSGSITGLNRVTTYHVRAFASNEAGTAYGDDIQFVTLADLPTVTTSDATSVTAVSATGHGNVTDDGGDTITERGFVWSLLANPTTADTKLIVSGTTGAFSGSITGLSADTTYHYRAYATNAIGTAYGADYTISTVLALPIVVTSAVTDIGSSAATANGDVVDAGGGTILERGFAWGTAPNPTTTVDNKVVVAGTLGAFTGPLVGLTSNALYHVRAYAINEAGIAYGADVFFTSLESGMGGGGGDGGAGPVAVGTVYSPDDEAGVVYAVDVTTGNLLLFYKKIDPLPYRVTDSARWNDGFDLPYTASALALALSAEDDEYDRYRAWIYEFISNSVADSLRNMAINKNVR